MCHSGRSNLPQSEPHQMLTALNLSKDFPDSLQEMPLWKLPIQIWVNSFSRNRYTIIARAYDKSDTFVLLANQKIVLPFKMTDNSKVINSPDLETNPRVMSWMFLPFVMLVTVSRAMSMKEGETKFKKGMLLISF